MAAPVPSALEGVASTGEIEDALVRVADPPLEIGSATAQAPVPAIASEPTQATRRQAHVRPGSPTPYHPRERAACRKLGGLLPCPRPPAHQRC